MFSLNINLFAEPDSLKATHYALNLTIESYDADFLRIYDNHNNFFFQGLYNINDGFFQTLILPVNSESLYVSLGDSLQSFALNPSHDAMTVDFRPPPPSWTKKLLWFKHDLEKVFPILALVIILLIKRQRDRKKQQSEEEA